jgi:hypothetical protein
MALTPGRTPLPGSPPVTSASTLSDMSGNQLVANTTTPKPVDGTPLIRSGLFAKPRGGVTAAGANGSNTNRPLSNALKDFHPVRDVVKAVSGEVKKRSARTTAQPPAITPSPNSRAAPVRLVKGHTPERH